MTLHLHVYPRYDCTVNARRRCKDGVYILGDRIEKIIIVETYHDYDYIVTVRLVTFR